MVKAYVTGAGGIIGSHLVEYLHKLGYEVKGSYYTPTVDLNDINKEGVDLFELDVRDHEKMKKFINEYLPDRFSILLLNLVLPNPGKTHIIRWM